MPFQSLTRWIVCVALGISCYAAIARTVFADDEPVKAPVPAERYTLRYQYNPNDLVYYDVKHHSTVTTKGEGLEEVTTNETSARKHYRVISVDKQGAGLLELVIDQVAMRVQFGNSEPVIFDSQSSEPPPKQFRQVQDSIGKPRARTQLSANGELKKVVVLNRAAAAPVGQLKSAPETDDADPSHNFLVVFPEQSVAVGETWSERIAVQVRINKSLLRPVTLLKRYTLKSVDGNLATIAATTRILTPIHDPQIRLQLIQRTPVSEAVFDIDRGLLVSRKTTLNQRLVGGITEKSSMHVVSHQTERLVLPEEVAAKEAESSRQ